MRGAVRGGRAELAAGGGGASCSRRVPAAKPATRRSAGREQHEAVSAAEAKAAIACSHNVQLQHPVERSSAVPGRSYSRRVTFSWWPEPRSCTAHDCAVSLSQHLQYSHHLFFCDTQNCRGERAEGQGGQQRRRRKWRQRRRHALRSSTRNSGAAFGFLQRTSVIVKSGGGWRCAWAL